MSILIQYLVKLSISLSVVWLFYQFVLRRLTFYNSNRWYLLGYTFLSFFIPFVNISSIIGNDSGSKNDLIQFIPSVHQYTIALEEASHCPIPIWSTQYDKWDWTAFALMVGAAMLLLRFIIRYISFIRIRQRSELISDEGIKIYQVNKEIIPFSFGNAVFINRRQHSAEELKEIIRHEFVHVRQNHTVDIVWAELLCILNWYNPFAWLLKKSIRQNLEFIADNKVIENGINKKEYQYLLLKVIGNSQFCIATQFNFSSLKKRIAMMNKTKSAKLQVGRFLFLFPVLAIILLAFRKSFTDSPGSKINSPMVVFTDTIPDVTTPNSKGYFIDIKDNKGNCMVVIKDKDKKEVKRLLLIEWNERAGYYENLYGEILSPTKVEVEKMIRATNPEIRTVSVKNNIATVTLKNGKTEVYTLTLKDQRKAFEERCEVKEVAIATTIATEANVANEVNTVTEVNVANETIADNFEITDKKAVMHLRNGKVEEYNLADPKEKAAFEKKFGKIIKPSAVSTTAGVYSVVTVADNANPSITSTVALVPTEEVAVIDENDNSIVNEVEELLTITKKTTSRELESFKKELKAKGIELNYDEIEYDKGILVKITGSLKSKDGHANFVGVEFNKIVISKVKKGEKTYFRVDEVVKKIS
jgi:hypothetical protein